MILNASVPRYTNVAESGHIARLTALVKGVKLMATPVYY
jgi:hypothetical protein